jgi:DNA-binding transcriptional regulator YdaS (Cro superfamily)
MPAKRRPRASWRWRTLEDLDPGLRLAVEKAGSMTNLARLIRIAPQAIAQWDIVPINRVLEIEKATGVDRELLRPDMFKRRKRAS